jgi:hypothetical protein
MGQMACFAASGVVFGRLLLAVGCVAAQLPTTVAWGSSYSRGRWR